MYIFCNSVEIGGIKAGKNHIGHDVMRACLVVLCISALLLQILKNNECRGRYFLSVTVN